MAVGAWMYNLSISFSLPKTLLSNNIIIYYNFSNNSTIIIYRHCCAYDYDSHSSVIFATIITTYYCDYRYRVNSIFIIFNILYPSILTGIINIIIIFTFLVTAFTLFSFPLVFPFPIPNSFQYSLMEKKKPSPSTSPS